MKVWKKFSAITLALVMALALCVPAFAAGDAGRAAPGEADDTYKGESKTTATGTSIPLTKSIVFVNANGSAVYEPNITYTYTVTPEDIDESTYTVDDGTTTGYVRPGVTDGVTDVSITFGTSPGGTDTTTVTASSTGAEVERTENLTVDLSKFKKPGIYRYKITETSNPAAVTDAGLTAHADNYNADRYLDVYITQGTDALEMSGAVIFKSTASTAGQDNITTSTTKTTGYAPTATSNLKDDATVDRYTTYDFSVKKAVAGNMADKEHQFPFYVSISNTITNAKYTYYASSSSTGTAETIASATITKGSDSKTSELKMKADEFVKFVGVPSNQTTNLAITIKEFNDTPDQYVPSVGATNGLPTMVTGLAMTASSGHDSTASFDIVVNDIANQILTITNTLTAVSPTGVVLRYAPYMAMMGAGIVALPLSLRKKEELF